MNKAGKLLVYQPTDQQTNLTISYFPEYEIDISYRVGQEIGYSAPSASVTCKTGASSAPVLPQVTGISQLTSYIVHTYKLIEL